MDPTRIACGLDIGELLSRLAGPRAWGIDGHIHRLPERGPRTSSAGGEVIAGSRSGYKHLHITYTTAGDLMSTSIAADVTTTANVQDNQMYVPLTSSSSLVFSLPSLRYMTADPGYDDKKLYEYSKKTLGIDLVCPVERYESTSKKRLELVCFYKSAFGQSIYNQKRNIYRTIDRAYQISV